MKRYYFQQFHACLIFNFALFFQSDMFSIGIVLFELFHPFSTAMERSRAITDLRKGKVDPQFSQKFPKFSAIISSLTNPAPNLRPSASELLKTQFSREALAQEKATREMSELRAELSQKDSVIQDLNSEIRMLREEIKRLSSH